MKLLRRASRSKMDKRDRLEAAINGAPVDRVPVALWRHWPGDDQRADDLAAVHAEFQERYDWDFVKVSPASSFCVEDWGVETVWDGLNPEGTRRYTRHVIDTPDDWSSLKPLDPRAGALGRQLECLDMLGKYFGSDVPFIQTIFSPLAQAKYLSGEGRLMLHLRQNAGQIHQALEAIAESTLRFIDEAKKTGIAGIYYAVQYANYDRLSEAEYQVFGLPYDRRVMDALDGLWLNVLHLHGPHPMPHLFSGYPVQVVNWHDRESEPDLKAGMRMFKGAASGGVNRDVLLKDDPEQALEQAREAIALTGGRRLILGTGCVTMVTTPAGNIRKLRDLVDEMEVSEDA